MGFFDGVKKAYQEDMERYRLEKEQKAKDPVGWAKAHPKKNETPKPQKLYEPGHKNMVGTVKNMALINMFGTSDLDEVIEKCAPEFTKAMYGVRDKVYEQDDYKAKYYELKGRYEELQKQNQELLQILKNLGQQ